MTLTLQLTSTLRAAAEGVGLDVANDGWARVARVHGEDDKDVDRALGVAADDGAARAGAETVVHDQGVGLGSSHVDGRAWWGGGELRERRV